MLYSLHGKFHILRPHPGIFVAAWSSRLDWRWWPRLCKSYFLANFAQDWFVSTPSCAAMFCDDATFGSIVARRLFLRAFWHSLDPLRTSRFLAELISLCVKLIRGEASFEYLLADSPEPLRRPVIQRTRNSILPTYPKFYLEFTSREKEATTHGDNILGPKIPRTRVRLKLSKLDSKSPISAKYVVIPAKWSSFFPL